MTFLSTNLQQGSGLNGKWRGGNVFFFFKDVLKLCFQLHFYISCYKACLFNL